MIVRQQQFRVAGQGRDEHNLLPVAPGVGKSPLGRVELGGCSAKTTTASPSRPAPAGGSSPGARRYVVGTGSDGKSYTQSSDLVSVDPQSGSDTGPGVLRVTDTMPVDNAAPVTATGAPSGGTGPFRTLPGPDGTGLLLHLLRRR
jgi:hypothetical protein